MVDAQALFRLAWRPPLEQAIPVSVPAYDAARLRPTTKPWRWPGLAIRAALGRRRAQSQGPGPQRPGLDRRRRGNLHASLLLIDPAPPRSAAELGFVSGVALGPCTARHPSADDRRLALKWPNDILYDGAKLAGISAGKHQSAERPSRLRRRHWRELRARIPAIRPIRATDLDGDHGRACRARKRVRALSVAMAHGSAFGRDGCGFEAIRAEWLALAAGVGTWIRVARPSQTMEGVFQTIDAAGRLILGQGSGEVAIEAGDVFLIRQMAKPPWPTGERLLARTAAPALRHAAREEHDPKVADFSDKIMRQNEESETVSDSAGIDHGLAKACANE